jgi:hypothetical protein
METSPLLAALAGWNASWSRYRPATAARSAHRLRLRALPDHGGSGSSLLSVAQHDRELDPLSGSLLGGRDGQLVVRGHTRVAGRSYARCAPDFLPGRSSVATNAVGGVENGAPRST